MERSERELIEKALSSNFELKKLYERHKEFEEKLSRLSRQQYLTPQEQQEERELKQMKLRGVEKMLKLATREEGLLA